MKRIEMTVGAIAIDKNGDPIVLLNDLEQKRALPIWVGLLEARAISLTTQQVKTKQPLTHQLMLNTIERLGYAVEKILLDVAAESDGYAASIVLSLSDNTADKEDTVSISARPSDALAIAIMAGLPVLVDREIVAQSSLAIHRDEPGEGNRREKRSRRDRRAGHGGDDRTEGQDGRDGLGKSDGRNEFEEADDRRAFKNFIDNLKASDFTSTDPIELPNDNVTDWPEAS